MTRDTVELQARTAPLPAQRTSAFTDQLIEPLTRLRGEVDRLFEDFPFRMPTLRFAAEATLPVPAVEMTETKKAYKITVELPGIDPGDVEVTIEDGMLRIAGEKKTERDEDEKGYRISERSYGAFERLLRLPAAADTDAIKARTRHGVLTVTIPKDRKLEQKARRVTINQA